MAAAPLIPLTLDAVAAVSTTPPLEAVDHPTVADPATVDLAISASLASLVVTRPTATAAMACLVLVPAIDWPNLGLAGPNKRKLLAI